MIEIPLFPLNLVLFPMQSLALHVFEDRYKQMIRYCIDTDSPFGVVLLERGAAEEGRSRVPPKPRMIGCTAHISQVQPLSEGRMNIVVVGRDRFRITDFDDSKPYLTAFAELSPMLQADAVVAPPAVDGLRRCVARYLKVLESAGRAQTSVRRLPSDPLTLASLAAVVLHDISADQRQGLLEAEDLGAMIDDLRILYRREIVLLEAMVAEPNDDQIAPFSPN